MKKNTALLISCTIGYGHQAAALNVEQRLRNENPDLEIITIDSKDYLSSIATKVSNLWDEQLRKGNFILSRIVPAWGIYEKIYMDFFDTKLSRDINELFAQHHITAIYDMQPLFTPSLYKAFVEACPDRPLVYNKILTDLPTPRNVSFLGGIKRTTCSSPHIQLKLHAPEPILINNQTLESFWRKHCRLPLSQIDESFALPVHPDYLRKPQDIQALKLNIHPDWQINLPLPSDAYVTALMLGSQGGDAIEDYVNTYMTQLQQNPTDRPHYFFIACSKNQRLYDNLKALLQTHPLHQHTPHRIIPLTMQSMDAIASLMWRSNQIIIRSGGISSLEQVALAQTRQEAPPKLFIHSTYQGSENSQDCLLGHTYAWERGNAEYLIHHLGAKMTAPQVIDFFS